MEKEIHYSGKRRASPLPRIEYGQFVDSRSWGRNHNRRIRKAVLDLMGGKCARCGFDDYRALQIDHLLGGGTKEVASLGSSRSLYVNILQDQKWNENYQLLCANCNWIKRSERQEHYKKEVNDDKYPEDIILQPHKTIIEIRKCLCGKEFKWRESQKNPGKYCSHHCQQIYQLRQSTGVSVYDQGRVQTQDIPSPKLGDQK